MIAAIKALLASLVKDRKFANDCVALGYNPVAVAKWVESFGKHHVGGIRCGRQLAREWMLMGEKVSDWPSPIPCKSSHAA